MGKEMDLLQEAGRPSTSAALQSLCKYLGLAACTGGILGGLRRLLVAPTSAQKRRHQRRIALIDNGSMKPEATLSLRRLAAALEALAADRGLGDVKVEAVSYKFSDRIAASKLEDKPAEILPAWLQRVASERPQGPVMLLPLFVGPSTTIGSSMPEAIKKVADLDVEIAPPLVCGCPYLSPSSPSGAMELATILAERLQDLPRGDDSTKREEVVFICDHGSPAAPVTRAREAVRVELEKKIGLPVSGCCMERREGSEYDFNGPLLEAALRQLPKGARARVALLFLQQGRHAGPGGDIAGIVADVQKERPDVTIATTEVMAGHPALLEILLQRMQQGVPVKLFAAHSA
mmetsp:Transcript_42935/g.100849  ORF Transcript_42935/g.100849 Transcript_42935/m.100849 type:complete len:347 (+) Transcript_42935:75-1115(+)